MSELPPPTLPETYTLISEDWEWDDVVSWELQDGIWFIKQLDGDTWAIDIKTHGPLRLTATTPSLEEATRNYPWERNLWKEDNQ